MSAHQQVVDRLVDPLVFEDEGFGLDNFLVSLTEDVIPISQQSAGSFGPGGGKDALSASDQVKRVQRLLDVLERAEGEVAALREGRAADVAALHERVADGEAAYRADLAGLERAAERVRAGARDIDQRAARLSSAAASIGGRLAASDAVRARCLEAAALLAHLRAFSMAPLGGADAAAAVASEGAGAAAPWGALPPPFDSDATLAEAAAVSHRLLALATDVAAARAKGATTGGGGGLGAGTGGDSSSGSSGGLGSAEHAVKVLTEYASRLEARVTARFDAAVEAGDVGAQAKCVRVLARCGKERALAQRWVASRAVFLAVDDASLEAALSAAPSRRGAAAEGSSDGGGGPGGAGAPSSSSTTAAGEVLDAQLRSLNALYRDLSSAAKAEAAAAREVFGPHSGIALEAFASRLFEQVVQGALEKLLGRRGPAGAGPAPAAAAAGAADGAAARRGALRLLVGAYERTGRLAASCERALRGARVDVGAIAEGLWPGFLGAYPAQELAWLDLAFREEAAQQESPELSLPFVLRIFERHREATDRAQRLIPAAQAPRAVRAIFHSPAAGSSAAAAAPGASGGGGHPGCLLEQLARHIAGGVDYALDLCAAGTSSSLPALLRMGLGAATAAGGSLSSFGSSSSLSAAASGAASAQPFVAARIQPVLDAARAAADVTAAAQAHFEVVVMPAVAGAVGEHGAAAGALLVLLRATEERVARALAKAVDAFVAQFERALAAEQRKSDFLPKDGAPAAAFDRPTAACARGSALLSALGAAARGALEGANLASFLAEAGRRAHAALLAHMGRFTYSPAGALLWKRDVAEYARALAAYGSPSLDDDMAALEQVVNALVVAPESLVGLVNGSLRMAHRDALRVIALREDFKTARVGGASLAQLFSGGVQGAMSLRV